MVSKVEVPTLEWATSHGCTVEFEALEEKQ